MNNETQQKILSLLKTLPEPYASQAVKNFDPVHDHKPPTSRQAALFRAFNWASSPEGGSYWVGVWDYLAMGKPLPEPIEPKRNPKLEERRKQIPQETKDFVDREFEKMEQPGIPGDEELMEKFPHVTYQGDVEDYFNRGAYQASTWFLDTYLLPLQKENERLREALEFIATYPYLHYSNEGQKLFKEVAEKALKPEE